MSTWQILHGDVRERLTDLQPGSVQCVVTSPPYWGLRDYGCVGQLGMQQTPDAYVSDLADVFDMVRDVLHSDGTCWVNLGDSYQNAKGQAKGVDPKQPARRHGLRPQDISIPGLKPKDLVGIPWMFAFECRRRGWYLRRDIIWSKPNAMCESQKDRPTSAHEYVFLLSKSRRYYYNADAIAEPLSEASMARYERVGRNHETYDPTRHKHGAALMHNAPMEVLTRAGARVAEKGTRNKRSVWTIPTQPYEGAHFAVFPEALVEPCILAGSRTAGKRCDCDDVIGTPLGKDRIHDPTLITGRAGLNRPRLPGQGRRFITRREQRDYAEQLRQSPFRDAMATAAGEAFSHYIRTDTAGARPIPPKLLSEWLGRGWLKEPAPCRHHIEPPDTILDPFSGSGTVGVVALRHQRNFVGIELNPGYVELARKRIGNVAPLLAQEIA